MPRTSRRPSQIDCDSHYGCHADDPPRTPHLDAGGIQPEIGPFALQLPIKEGVNAVVDLDAEAGDLALGDAGHAHRFHQIIDRAGRETLTAGFLDHGRHRFF
jgi:hypothetical protein